MKSTDQLSDRKREFRQSVAQKKREIGCETLHSLSVEIIKHLESTDDFKSAASILAYYSLPFEVETAEAIDSWAQTKTIYLPVVVGDQLKIKRYNGKSSLSKGAFGVFEPNGEIMDDLSVIDLVLVPGVAFDKNRNRMGYGKGFYDKLLPLLRAKKVGICFDFQLFEEIPTDSFDQSVDFIVSELQIVL